MAEEENKKFLFELIDMFRNKIGSFEIRTGTDLRVPLQISLFWFKSEKNDLQLFLVNHNEEYNDKIIEIFGPYNIGVKTTFQEFELSLSKGLFLKYIGDIENEMVLRNKIIVMVRKQNRILKEEPKNEITSNGVFYKDCFYFFHNGDIFKRSIDEIMNYYQKEKKRNERISKTFKNLPHSYEMVPFLAGYIIPPIWIGELPNLTMEDQIKGKRLVDFVKTIYKGDFLGRKIIVMNHGYLGISMKNKVDELPKEEELFNTIRILNFLFSVFLVKGIKVKTVQASEFSSTTYLPEKDLLSETHRGYSESEKLFKKKYEPLDLESFKKFRNIVNLDNIINSIELAKTLIKDPKLFNSLLLLIHSHSNLLNSETNQSFILSWTILEQYLNFKWDKLLEKKEVLGKRKKKLKGRDYTASIKMEMLNVLGYITKEDYIILNELRKERNKFMHEITQISRERAIQTLNLAIIYSKIRIEDYLQENE